MSQSDSAITRRAMLARTAQVAACALASRCGVLSAQVQVKPEGAVIWDAHCHLSGVEGTPQQRAAGLLKYADRLGIDRIVVSMGLHWSTDPAPEDLRQQNDEVLRAIEAAKGRIIGLALLNPKHTDASLAELDRCVRDGPMVGAKLWIAMKCNDRRVDPLVRRAVELKVPILQHAYLRTGGNPPNESDPFDVAEMAARHPDATILCGHTGNDWEQGVRAIRATKNVYADISGCDPTAGMVDVAVRELGAERVLFASDAGGRSYASQLGKVVGADISEAAKRLVLGENLRRLLGPLLAARGMA
jgi:predicted TIM-barrel fold metal-dependent hydrolase